MGTQPSSTLWRLRYRDQRNGPVGLTGEQSFADEAGFKFALRTAWRNFASDISATLDTGEVLDDAALRRRYPVV